MDKDSLSNESSSKARQITTLKKQINFLKSKARLSPEDEDELLRINGGSALSFISLIKFFTETKSSTITQLDNEKKRINEIVDPEYRGELSKILKQVYLPSNQDLVIPK